MPEINIYVKVREGEGVRKRGMMGDRHRRVERKERERESVWHRQTGRQIEGK